MTCTVIEFLRNLFNLLGTNLYIRDVYICELEGLKERHKVFMYFSLFLYIGFYLEWSSESPTLLC